MAHLLIPHNAAGRPVNVSGLPAGPLAAVLAAARQRDPVALAGVLDASGRPLPHWHVAVDGGDVPAGVLSAPVGPDSEILLFPALAGG